MSWLDNGCDGYDHLAVLLQNMYPTIIFYMQPTLLIISEYIGYHRYMGCTELYFNIKFQSLGYHWVLTNVRFGFYIT